MSSIEERLVKKMTDDFHQIENYVENHPFQKEHICYGDKKCDHDENLNYMSYTRPLFTSEDGTYLILMVTEWKRETQEMKSFYLWNGKIYLSFHELVFSLKSQFLKFKMLFDFS
jgi:hypothetical protein